jgi:uncharacterized protein
MHWSTSCNAAPRVRLSAFNLYVEGYPEPGDVLVHNTFSGAYAVLDADVVAALRKADAGRPLDADEAELIDDPDLRDPNVGLVVDSRAVEEQEFRAWFQQRRARTNALEVLVSVNLACNFACTYCSQGEILDGSVMPEVTADHTADWIARRAVESGVDSVFLMFCGGEPLLHPARIARIASRIRDAVAPRGLPVTFGLITNGYFLTADMLDALVPLGLVMAQVTLDGDGTTHAVTRVSKKGEDTFQRVFDHVIAASRRIRIKINGNYQENTVRGFAPLLALLEQGGLPAGSQINFTPALQALGAKEGSGSGSCTWSGSKTDLHVALQDEILRHGFDTGGAIHAVGPCEFHDHHSFAVDPDGTIYKCPGFMAHPEWGIGHVSQGLSPRYQQMIAVNPQRECGSCAHRPNCAGGCVATQWLAVGRIDGVNCELPFFESVQQESLVRSYLLATSGDTSEALAAFPAPRVALGDTEAAHGRVPGAAPGSGGIGGAEPRERRAPHGPPDLIVDQAPPTASRGRRSAALRVLAA